MVLYLQLLINCGRNAVSMSRYIFEPNFTNFFPISAFPSPKYLFWEMLNAVDFFSFLSIFLQIRS